MLIATATLSATAVASAHAAAVASGGSLSIAAAVARSEGSLEEFERPWDVLCSVYRVSLTPAQGAAQSPVFRFDIPSGEMAAVTGAFERTTGIDVSLPTDVATIVSPGVTGVLTAEQAMARLLAATPLSHRFTSNSAIEIRLRASDDVVDVRDRLATVNSIKFSQPLLDTPQTLTVVPREVIESQGATSLRDVLRNVPGITMQAGEGGGGLPGDTLSIRGFSAASDIFIDGIRDAGPYSRDAFNLEQVEIIKGPASTFAGRGSTGGAINLSTKSVEDTYGVHRVKLPAGDLVLYPATSLHHVTPVTRGARVASFFWIQSLVRDDGRRTLLFDLDTSIQRLNQDLPSHPSTIQLTGVYHNLLRQWADI